jgi:hypothetical protein
LVPKHPYHPLQQPASAVRTRLCRALQVTNVDGSGTGYLKTACDYVHLNPVGARMLKDDERLLAYPWSSFGAYVAAPEHRPAWIRVDRLVGEHRIQEDTASAAALKGLERNLLLHPGHRSPPATKRADRCYKTNNEKKSI